MLENGRQPLIASVTSTLRRLRNGKRLRAHKRVDQSPLLVRSSQVCSQATWAGTSLLLLWRGSLACFLSLRLIFWYGRGVIVLMIQVSKKEDTRMMSNNNVCPLIAKVDDTQAPSIDDTIHLFHYYNNKMVQIIVLSTGRKIWISLDPIYIRTQRYHSSSAITKQI